MHKNKWMGILFLWIWVAMPLSTFSQNTQEFVPKSVRFVYLVSSDRAENPAYTAAIQMAALNIQTWYKKQLGTTFLINNPVVEIAYSNKNATWFYANPNGNNPDNWGYNNTYDEVHRLLNTQFNDPDFIWVIYSDGPGNSGRGGSGVCIMPEDDLLGLTGQHPEQKEINRWIAGLGHEIGHAFGLSHPADTKKDADAIMWTGIYGKYPDQCYLTTQDKDILNQSPFFFDDQGNPNAGKLEMVEQYVYGEGYFTRYKNLKTKEMVWKETKKSSTEFYDFKETKKSAGFYYLKSVNRKISIKIPSEGGNSYLSNDGERNWNFFQTLEKIK
jgi:hypothetical protein